MSVALPRQPTPPRPVRPAWRPHGPILWQAAILALVVAVIAIVAAQTVENLRLRGIASGFEYLGRAAGFEISRGPIAYTSRDTYARALLVGLLNSLRISFLGIVLATALGSVVGLARLSRNRIVSTLAGAYTEVIRNTPLLLQLLFWYSVTQTLPAPREAFHPLPGVFVCYRGLFLPSVAWNAGVFALEHPVLAGFGFRGGTSISPEFAVLLVGLSTYTAAFIGEVVRGGIRAVDRGQREAATALGLSRFRALRFVVAPQALRVIVPPMTTQFLNLFKNSSLAVAIGYPDLISITNTTLNQTGQAIEAITLAMAVYLAFGLVISLAMNVYNRRVALRGQGRA